MDDNGDVELTERQTEALDAITLFIEEHDYSPSVRELQEILGFSSPAPVQSLLRRLRDKGCVTWNPGQSRTLRLLP